MRYFLEFSYRGTSFHGWQKQPNAPTIQEEIEQKMGVLLNNRIEIVGAGRTDTGVHALQMFAHFNCEMPLPINFIDRLNAFLHKDIVVISILPVKFSTHARFDAISRTYEYRIITRKSPFYRDSTFFVKHPLDIDIINLACQHIKGKQDFECFSKSNSDVRHFYCDIEEAKWYQNDDFLFFEITADRFLRNMVRAIVGTMVNIGIGKIPPNDIQKIVTSKNRKKAGYSAPAQGLFLKKIIYKKDVFL